MILDKQNIKDLSFLSSFEGIGLIIIFLTLPIVTRIYDPADFGNFEKYVVLVGIIANLCLLNFEFKIYDFTSKKDQTLSLITCLFFTVFFSAIFICFSLLLLNIYPTELIYSYEIIFLILFWILFVSLASITLNYFSSLGNFKQYSLIRLLSNIVLIVSQIIFGLFGFNFMGFIYAIILQNIFISVFGIKPIYNQIKIFINDFIFSDILNQIKNNKNILIFTFPGSLINRLTLALPIYFLSSFNPIFLGYYAFGSQLLNYPLKLFNGLGNMYKKEFSDEIRLNQTFNKTFIKYLKIFSIVSIVLLLSVFLFSSFLVPILFGKQWTDSIHIMKILVLMVSVRYIVAGLSSVLLIGNLPKYDIFFQLAYLLFSFISIYIAKQIFNSYSSVIYAYVISSIILYIFYFYLIKYFSTKQIKSINPK
tara:strand:- start:8709 stop:9971 length:1263 start_codon:yes stop_codon:yes gene_type:complete